MRITATVSWSPSMHRPPTHPSTACVYRTYWPGCRRKRLDSMYSCWTCAAKGENDIYLFLLMIGVKDFLMLRLDHLLYIFMLLMIFFFLKKPQWWYHCTTRTDQGDSKYSVWICHVSFWFIFKWCWFTCSAFFLLWINPELISLLRTNKCPSRVAYWCVQVRRRGGIWSEAEGRVKWHLHKFPQTASLWRWKGHSHARQSGWRYVDVKYENSNLGPQ